jgi:hypothetical protein
MCRELVFKHLTGLDSADLSVAITTEDDGDSVVITIYDPEMDYDFDFDNVAEDANKITYTLMTDLIKALAMTESAETEYNEDEQEWVITLPVNLDTDADISHSADS